MCSSEDDSRIVALAAPGSRKDEPRLIVLGVHVSILVVLVMLFDDLSAAEFEKAMESAHLKSVNF